MRRTQDAQFVVINIGNSFISGLLASKDSSGKVIPILHCEQESGDGIKRGKIFNEDEVKTAISAIVDELSRYVGDDYSISSVYLGIEPMGMRMRLHSVTYEATGAERNRVSLEQIASMRAEAMKQVEDGYTAIHIETPLILVDDKLQYVSKIDGVRYKERFTLKFPTIEVDQSILEEFDDLFKDLKLEIKGYIPTPIVEAQTSIGRPNLSVGAAYVNIGGGSTSISIYQNGHLQGLYILPLGGKNITQDLTKYRLTWAEAEAIKREYGLVINDENQAQVIDISGNSVRSGKSIKLRDVVECTQSRMTEILENVYHIIKQAGGESLIADKFVSFAGGATLLKGFEELGLERCIILDSYLGIDLGDDLRFTQSSVLALAYYAQENCLKEVVRDLESLTEDPASSPIAEAVEPEVPTQPSLSDQIREIKLSSREETEEEKQKDEERKQSSPFWERAIGGFRKQVGGVMNNFSAKPTADSTDDDSDEED